MSRTRIEDVGRRYGRLTVLSFCDDGHVMMLCRCDCGNVVRLRSTNVRHGRTKSCGCLRRETSSEIGRNTAPAISRAINQRYDTNFNIIAHSEPDKRNKTGKKGVWQSPRTGLYHAYISVHNKRHDLGSYSTFDRAAHARDVGEQIYHAPLIEARDAELLGESSA